VTAEALGFCTALREAFPQTKEQRRWFHKARECPCCATEVGASGALAATEEIWNAEDADKARAAITALERDHGAKFPKAVAKIVEAAEVLMEFYSRI
jgi:putative transposase